MEIKGDKKIFRNVSLGINIIAFLVTAIWYVILKNKVEIVEDYITYVFVLIFLFAISLVLIFIKKKWTFILGIVIFGLSIIGEGVIGVQYYNCTKNLYEIYEFPYGPIEFENELMYVDKPVIYIYPESTTDVEAQLINKENITVSYPKYNEGWKVKAYPDGTLEDAENKKYYSLYYEAKDILNNTLDTEEGFVVKREEIVEFLEEKLEILGLNYKEKEEFIIYWLPQLEKNEYIYVRFETREEIEHNMPIKITPTPDNFIRVVMEWKGLDEVIEVKEQQLEKANRDGFTVVEWGGMKLR